MTTNVDPADAVAFPSRPDVSHATNDVVALFTEYFQAKSAHDVERWVDTFDPARTFYADATLGWTFDSRQAFHDVVKDIVPNWADGISYPTRILGDARGAIIFLTDTPQLFGSEIRAIAVADISDGKIVRFVDYWDGHHFGAAAAGAMRTPAAEFPASLGEDTVTDAADPMIVDVIRRLHATSSTHDHAGAAALFAPDAILEDMALRAQLVGRSAVARYLRRGTATLPWCSAPVVHTVGSAVGGGYEWRHLDAARDGAPLHGATGLELDESGRISRLTTVWDSARIDDAELDRLLLLTRDEGPADGDPW